MWSTFINLWAFLPSEKYNKTWLCSLFLHYRLRPTFFFCCRLEAFSQLLVAESACSTNNAKIPWWYFGAHCQNTWEFCETGTDPDLCSTPKRKERKKSDLIILHAQNRFDGFIIFFLMLIYSTIILPNILPFLGSWHVICQCCDSRKIRNVYWTHPHILSYTSKGVMPVMTQ